MNLPISPLARSRLADYHVTLLVKSDTPEDTLERICHILESMNLREKIQLTVDYYVKRSEILRPLVKAEVDE